MFDPYHKWLGIPKDQRPPTHYQLLGLAFGEADPEVIEEASIRQTAHLRAYQIGPNAAECTRILNEIAKARTTLLDPAKRKQYDQQIAPKDTNTAVTAQEPAPAASPFDQLESASSKSNLVSVKPRTKSAAGLLLGLGAVLAVGIAATIVVVVMWNRGEEKPHFIVQKPPDDKTKPKPVDDKSKPKPVDDKKPLEEKKAPDDLPPALTNSPRDRLLAGAEAYWNLGYGGKGSKHPLTAAGKVELQVPASGSGAHSGAKVARMDMGYFNAGSAVLAQGEALTLLLRMRDPAGAWNYALFARRRGPESQDINFNLAAWPGEILFEVSTDAGPHMLRVPLSRIDKTAWHDLIVRYDGQWLQLWCDGTLHAEKACRGTIKPSTAPVLIGAAADGDKIDFLFTGEMEEAAFWNVALTDADLQILLRRPQLARAVPDRPTATAGLVEIQPGEVYQSNIPPNFVRFSPDGRLVFLQHSKGIAVWDVAENKEVRLLPFTQPALHAAVSPDGKRLAVSTPARKAVVWDVDTGAQLFEVDNGQSIMALSFSVDGKVLATSGGPVKKNGAVRLWNAQDGAPIKTIQGFAYPASSIALTDEVLYAVDSLRSLYLVDLKSDQIMSKKQLTSFSPFVRFSSNAKQMGFLKAGRLSLWDLKEDKEIRGADLPTGVQLSPNGLDITADGRMAVVAFVKPHQLMVLDLVKGVALKTLDGHQQFIRAAALAPDGKRAFSVDQNRMVRIWKLDDEAAKVAALKPETQPETKPETKVETKLDPKFIPEWVSIKCPSYSAVSITPDGRRAVTAGPGVDVWDLSTGKLWKSLDAGGSAFGGVAIAPDGSFALTASGDNTLRLWDLGAGQLEQSHVYPAGRTPHAVAWSANGQNAAVGTGSVVDILDPKTLKVKAIADTGKANGDVNSVAFFGIGYVVYGMENGTVRTAPLTGAGAKTIYSHTAGTAVHQVVTVGNTILSAGVDKTLYVWDTTKRGERYDPRSIVRAIATSPKGNFAITGGDDTKIRFWNVKNGKVIHVYPAAEGVIRALAFSPNGQFFLSTSDDGTLRVWRLPKDIAGK